MPSPGERYLLPDGQIAELINRHQFDNNIWVTTRVSDGSTMFLSADTVDSLSLAPAGAGGPIRTPAPTPAPATAPTTVPTPAPTAAPTSAPSVHRRRTRQAEAVAPESMQGGEVAQTPPQVPVTPVSQICPYCQIAYSGTLGVSHSCITIQKYVCKQCHIFNPDVVPSRRTANVVPKLCNTCRDAGYDFCKKCGEVFRATAEVNGRSVSHSLCIHCDNLSETNIWAKFPCPVGGPVINEIRTHRPFSVEIESYLIPAQSIIPRAAIQHWEEATDASIHPDDDDEAAYSVEWRSPPMTGDKGLEFLSNSARKIRDMGFRANKSCGLHVHFDISDISKQDMAALKNFGLHIEVPIFKLVSPSRLGNNFCRGLNDVANTSRYRWMNLQEAFDKHHTVEFRLHQGTTVPDRIVEWVKVCALILETGLKLGYTQITAGSDLFNILGFTRYQKLYWMEVVERLHNASALAELTCR